MKLWSNGFIHTLSTEAEVMTEMITDCGYIFSIGDDLDKQSVDEVIDLNGAHVYPGFVDSHLHILGYAEKLNQIDLSLSTSIDEIKHHISSNLDLGFITFYGLPINAITKNDLNDISFKKPIIVKHNDYHSYTVNDYVLDKVGINRKNGIVDLDEMVQINKIFLSYTKEDLKRLIDLAINKLYSFGLTGGHSDDLHYFNGYHETLQSFKESLNQNPFRTQLLIHYKALNEFRKSGNHFLDQNKYLQLGPVKLFYDGTISSKTALLNDLYKNSNHHGQTLMSNIEFIDEIIKARSLSLPVAIHVIGDKGLEEVLDILKKYPPKEGLLDRIIHASIASKKAIEMMRYMPLIIDVQPQFIKSDFPHSFDMFSKIPSYIYPFKTMMDHHIILCGSSDAPVEIPNPLLGIHALTTRKMYNNKPLNESESISRFDAVKLYTTNANVPTYKRNRGLIKKGYIADFSIFSKDILTIPTSQLLTILPIMTVIDEKIVYTDNKKTQSED